MKDAGIGEVGSLLVDNNSGNKDVFWSRDIEFHVGDVLD